MITHCRLSYTSNYVQLMFFNFLLQELKDVCVQRGFTALSCPLRSHYIIILLRLEHNSPRSALFPPSGCCWLWQWHFCRGWQMHNPNKQSLPHLHTHCDCLNLCLSSINTKSVHVLACKRQSPVSVCVCVFLFCFVFKVFFCLISIPPPPFYFFYFVISLWTTQISSFLWKSTEQYTR